MTVKLIVATELANKDLKDEITSLVEALSDIELIIWQDGVGEKGAVATNVHPDVVIIDDAPQFGPMPERIGRLRKNHPHVSIFIASQEQNPGQIVAAMKAGAAEFLISPFNKKVVSRALDEVRETIQKNRSGGKGRVFSFISAKGGLGSTVLATNSGVIAAHKHRQRTSLCDLSCQSGDSAVLLDLSPKTDMADIAENFHRLDLAMLRDCMCRHSSGLELLSAPFRPERCETIKPDHVSHILEMLTQLYEIILVDCTSMFVNPSDIEAFRGSETIFIVTDLSVPALRNASRLAHYINGLGISHDRIEYVAMMMLSRP